MDRNKIHLFANMRKLGRLQHERRGEVATALRFLGEGKAWQGDLAAALAAYDEARRLRTATATLETPDGAELLINIGIAKW